MKPELLERPTQTQGEHANSIQTPDPGPEPRNLLAVMRKCHPPDAPIPKEFQLWLIVYSNLHVGVSVSAQGHLSLHVSLGMNCL